MTHDTESGFGTGLRAQLQKKRNPQAEPAAPPDLLSVLDEPLTVEMEEVDDAADVEWLRMELETARDRERKIAAELAEAQAAIERAGDVQQLASRTEALRAEIEERDVVLRIQLDQVETDRADAVRIRTELVAEQARLEELARHIDSRGHELESAGQERAQAGAHIAQQLAALAERERELKREQAVLDARRQGEETRVASREDAIRKKDESLRRREETLADREQTTHAAIAELRAREQALEGRDAAFAKQSDARERMLANGEAALAAWERRLRSLGERLEREQSGQGQASRDAFELLAELERREEAVGHREGKLLEAEESFASRSGMLDEAESALRLRDARLHVDLDLREDTLEDRERAVGERERLMDMRERELAAYVSELQGQLNDRNVA